MRRREFVKAMMAASVSARAMLGQQTSTPVAPSTPPVGPGPGTAAAPAPGPVPWMSGMMEVKPLPVTPLVADSVAQTNSNFFSQQETATLRKLCEILLPPLQGHPGAIDAGAPEFLDFLIGASPADRQRLYQSGLDRLNSEAKQHFGVPFSSVSKAQADRLLRPWLKSWMNDHPPADTYARFINTAHSDIRTATINSEAWSKAAIAAGKATPEMGLYWYPVDPDMRQKAQAAAQASKRIS